MIASRKHLKHKNEEYGGSKRTGWCEKDYILCRQIARALSQAQLILKNEQKFTSMKQRQRHVHEEPWLLYELQELQDGRAGSGMPEGACKSWS